MNTIDVNPNRFLRHWIFHALGVWFVACIASLVSWTPVAILISVLSNYSQFDLLIPVISGIAVLTLPGLSIGYVLGDMQYVLLRDFFKWDFSSDWVRASSTGGLAGGVIVIMMSFVFGGQFTDRLQWIMMLPLFMLPVSLMQWRILRTVVRDAWVWVLANVAGAVVFGGLFFSTQPFPFVSFPPLATIASWFVAATVLGAITGVIMLWLYEHPRSEWDTDEGELAPVYIEVRNRDKQ